MGFAAFQNFPKHLTLAFRFLPFKIKIPKTILKLPGGRSQLGQLGLPGTGQVLHLAVDGRLLQGPAGERGLNFMIKVSIALISIESYDNGYEVEIL